MQLRTALHDLRFTVCLEGLHIHVTPFAGTEDYGAHLAALVACFGTAPVSGFSFAAAGNAPNPVEDRILAEVARVFPAPFAALAGFVARLDARFIAPEVARFEREAQFYLAWLALMAPLQAAGLPFCLPAVAPAKTVTVREGYDLALAGALASRGVVCNDFHLTGDERLLVVSGPNQGGKTTFARMFGQLHYLGCLGLPVPARSAQLHLFDRMFTHFAQPEAGRDGKLEEELQRLHAILAAAGSNSIVLLNEPFSSTAFRDALALSGHIARRFAALDLLGVWVSFLDGLSGLEAGMVSMVCLLAAEDPARRSFRLVRQPADGLAYARSIAARHHLLPAQLQERLQPQSLQP